MTELIFTRHATEKLRELELSTVDAFDLFINADKRQVKQGAYIRKQSMHHHRAGHLYYVNGNFVLIIQPLPRNVFRLITIYYTQSPEVFI